MVQKVQSSEILDFKTWWPQFYKKSCLSDETKGKHVKKDKKQYFSISKFMDCTYDTKFPSKVIGRPFIHSIMNHSFTFRATGFPNLCFPSKEAYPAGKVSIKIEKMADIKKLQPYIPVEFEDFYAEIYMWPTTEVVEVENDD